MILVEPAVRGEGGRRRENVRIAVHEVDAHADGSTRGNSVCSIMDWVVRAYSRDALGDAIVEAEGWTGRRVIR